MNQQRVDYLQNNKDSYTKESFIMQLKDAGYGEDEIKNGSEFVYKDDISNLTNVQIINKKFKKIYIRIL